MNDVQVHEEIFTPRPNPWLHSPKHRELAERVPGLIEQLEARERADKIHYTQPATQQRIRQWQKEWDEAKLRSPDYQLLGLTNHEGQLLKKHVRNAYRRQSRKLHPDSGGNDEAFKELHAAYRRVLASVSKE
jgi:DnaJ-class molecular chaperone